MIEINIATLEVSNCEDSFHSDVSHVVLALADNLGTECSCGAFAEEFVVILLNVNFLLNSVDSLGGNIACTLEAIGDLEGVNALVEELLSLVKKGSSENNDTCGSITDFIVLRL